MAIGGRRRLVRLLAEGVTDPGRLMGELKVGPVRLRVLLESPSVRRWRVAYDAAAAVLEGTPLEGGRLRDIAEAFPVHFRRGLLRLIDCSALAGVGVRETGDLLGLLAEVVEVRWGFERAAAGRLEPDLMLVRSADRLRRRLAGLLPVGPPAGPAVRGKPG